MPRIREAAEDAREMHILMNNCYANYGSTNARELASMLEAELVGGGARASRRDPAQPAEATAPRTRQTARGGGARAVC